MVPPNGVSFARSGSTWIHWWSPVASAKASMSFWVTSCQSETPSSSPSACLSSSSPVMVRMAGTVSGHYRPLPGGPRDGTHARCASAGGGATRQPIPRRHVRRRGDARGRRPPARGHAAGPGGTVSAERRFATLVERLPAIVYEAEPGPEGAWLYVSGFVETLLGYTPEEWRADPALWLRCVHEDDREDAVAADERLSAGERIAIEYRMHARDGSVVWVRDDSSRVLDEDGRVFVEGLLTDITERKAAESRLQHLADHDALTNLLNSRRFLEELEFELAATRRGMRASAVLVIDVDGLKFVNDSLGHPAGDELILTVARALAGRLRASDALARLGGDEFACLLRGTS